MPLILSSCGDKEALRKAAAEQARATAKTNLPPLPGECDQDVPHAQLVIGLDPLNLLKLERMQLNRSNESKARCVAVHNAQAKALR